MGGLWHGFTHITFLYAGEYIQASNLKHDFAILLMA